MIVSIIPNLPMHKKSKEILVVIVRSLIEVGIPSLRGIAKKLKKISFIRYAISLAVDIYSMTLMVSKTGRLVLMLEGIKK
ncbi:hypothetical protein H5T89_01590 [bacterium]|nr:hypothetical protein [bacterium]